MHEVALLDDHVNTVLAPLATEVGMAVSKTVGAGVLLPTFTVVDAVPLPPAPAQVSVNVLVAESAPLLVVSLTSLDPDHAPDAVHDVAPVDDHVRVTALPLATAD